MSVKQHSRLKKRNKAIVRLIEKGVALKNIGIKYGLTRERVRQIAHREKKVKLFVSVQYIARIIRQTNSKIPPERMISLVKAVVRKSSTIKKRVVFRMSRTKKRRRVYVVHRDEIVSIQKTIQKQNLLTKLFVCSECGGKTDSTGKKYCPGCAESKRKSEQKRYSKEIREGKRKTRFVSPWIVQSIKLIQKHRVDFHTETWISQNEANKMAGISNGFRSLILLRQQGLLKIHRNHNQKHCGKTVSLYAKSEMEIMYKVRKRLGLVQKPQI